MKWTRLIIEGFIWAIALYAIIQGIRIKDALLLGEGVFILWAWLFFMFMELRSEVREICKSGMG